MSAPRKSAGRTVVKAGGKGGTQVVVGPRLGPKTAATVGVAGWVSDGALTRGPLLVMLAAWPTGLLASMFGDPLVIFVLGMCAAALAYAVGERSGDRDWGIRVTILVASVVTWLALCRFVGPAGFFDRRMFLGYVVGCTSLWLFLFRAPHVRGRHQSTKDNSKWKMFAEQIGLEGSTVAKAERTRLGYRIRVNVTNTGKTASKLATKTLNEALAGKLGLPASRVLSQANPRNAGQIILTVRTTDPWATPIPHPMTDRAARDGAPVTSAKDPIVILEDPESGNPGTIQLFTKEGAQHFVIVASTRGGKTTLLNVIIEHLTRAENVIVKMIDVSKGKDGRAWVPAVHDAAMGPDAVPHALAILRDAKALIVRRAASNPDAVFRISRRSPAEVIILDEASELLGRKDDIGIEARSLVAFIEGKGASEMVSLLIAAQRGVLAHLGTGDVKANAMIRILLGVAQSSEMQWVVPDWEARGMPDMSTYGEGVKGVALVAPGGRAWFAGRVLDLSDLDVIREIAAERNLRPDQDPTMHEGIRVPVAVGQDPLMVEPPADGVDGPDVDEEVATPEPAVNESGTGRGRLATDRLDGHEDDDGSVADLRLPDGRPDGVARAKAATAGAVATADAVLADLAGLAPGQDRRAWLARIADVVARDRAVTLTDDAVQRVLELATRAGLSGFTRADLEEATGLSRTVCAEDLRVMVGQGYLVRSGGGRTYRYMINMDREYEE